MGEALLATSGDTIKLWDAKTYAFYREIPSECGHVSKLVWNQDGQCLASLGDSGKEICLSAICGKSEATIGVVRGIEDPTCLNFACRSPHYLGVGSASGTVTIWNVKSQTKKKVFAPTEQAITKVAFSHSDSHIATATKKGSLYMLSVTNNLTAGPYQLFKNQVVTDLTYSRVKKSLLGCCSEGGTVALYDTHANKVVHAFPSAHSSPVAAISFSPINQLLMVSVGYDKKLSCFNVQTKQPVMTHRSTAPLTSITFLGMGQLVALGTMTGQVFVHDMRTIRSPLATLSAHKTAVTNVLLQPCTKSKSFSSTKTGQRNTTTPTLTVPVQKTSKSCSDQPTDMSPELRANQEASPKASTFDLSVFSPIRDTDLSTHVQASEATGFDNLNYFKTDIPMESIVSQSLFSPIRTTDPQHNLYTPLSHHMDINEDNLLSPIRDTTLTTRSDSINLESPSHQLESPSAMEVTVTSPIDVNDKENIEPSPAVMKEHGSTLQQTECKSVFTSSILDAPQMDEPPSSSCFPQEAVVNSPSSTYLKTPQEPPLTPKVDPSTRCESTSLPDAIQRPTLPPTDTSSTLEESKGTKSSKNSSIWSYPAIVTSPASQLTIPFTTTSKLSPPKKRQLLRPVQASDLARDTPPETTTAAAAARTSAMPAASHGVPQLQMELVRSCMVDVLEEFQDEVNSRLMHLQYIITKKFIHQQEVMEQMHRQYSLNEDLMKENEKLRQQVAHLQAKY